MPEVLPEVPDAGEPDVELEDVEPEEVEVDGVEGIDDEDEDGDGIEGIDAGEGGLGDEVALLVAQPASNAALTATGNSRTDRMFRCLR